MAKEANQTCRTCLGNNEQLVSIYNGDDNRLVEMLEYILDTQLEATDGLPQKVCHECFNDISHCYSFKTKCNNSFKILRNLLDKRKNLIDVVMQVKVEPGVNISDEFFEAQNESQNTIDPSQSHHALTTVQMEGIFIKTEPVESTSVSDTNEMTVSAFDKSSTPRQLSPNQMSSRQLQLYEKEIFPPTQHQVDNDHYEHFQEPNKPIDRHTVQYLIRELNEERHSVDQLLEMEVNIRHCASCGAGFAQDTDFNKHIKICGQSKKMKEIKRNPIRQNKHLCPYCDKAFPRPCRLKNHLRRYHQEILANKFKEATKTSKKDFMCPHCDMSFILESSLKFHLSTHKIEKQFKNSLLEQSLNKKLILNFTNNINPKNYKCKECYQEFELASQLQIHMLDHKKKHDYVCKLCQKLFIHEHELKMHSIRVHNDEKPFKCKFCATGFVGKYNLIYHQRKYLCKGK